MTDERINILELEGWLREKGLSDDDIKEMDTEGSKIHLLTFGPDNTGTSLISYYKSIVVFVNPRYHGKVNDGETWFCRLEMSNRAFHAQPLFKVTPTLLLRLNDEMREDLLVTLWERNRFTFEADFARMYKDEIHSKAVEEARSEMQSIIDDLTQKVSDLQNKMEQDRILNKSLSGTSMIELGSDDVLPTEVVRSPTTPAVPREEIPHIPSIPDMRTSAPGMPELRTLGTRPSESMSVVYDVTRTAEETIYSESFTDPKYFVHISPDCRMLVIRPSSFGTALCFDRRIRLQGLGSLSPFTERKKLTAEYSSRYGGMIVYL